MKNNLIVMIKNIFIFIILVSLTRCESNKGKNTIDKYNSDNAETYDYEAIKYSILNEETLSNSIRIQVVISNQTSKLDLATVASELKEKNFKYEKIWISFYEQDLLPDKDGNGAWAVASYNPNLEITIFNEGSINNEGLLGPLIIFPNYSQVLEMLQSNGDYKGNCLKLLSKKGELLHIQVSNEFIYDEPISIMKEQVKRDIVYVAFQAFSQTNIKKLKISSVPIIRTSFNPNIKNDGKYLNELKQTVIVSRETAKKILKKYLRLESFKDLYVFENSFFVPNKKFDRLKYGELENVFLDIKKAQTKK